MKTLLFILLWLPTSLLAQLEDCEAAIAAHSSEDVTVWNYFGSDFSQANTLSLHAAPARGYWTGTTGVASSEGGFQLSPRSQRDQMRSVWLAPNIAQVEMESGSVGETLLHRNQFTSLLVMQDAGYIDKALSDAQVHVVDSLHPDQVLFFELTSESTYRELVKKYGRLPPFARENPLSRAVRDYFSHFAGMERPADQERDDRTYQVKEGTAWLISGQPQGSYRPIYLENEALAKPIDRTAHPFIWEIGRAAQIESGKFFKTSKLAVFYAVRELLLLGGRLEDAYFFAHSLNSKVDRAYRLRYGFEPYSLYTTNSSEQAIVASLSTILTHVDLQDVSERVATLVELSGGQLSPFAALKHSLWLDQNIVEVLTDESSRSIEIRDFSSLPAYLSELYIKSTPSTEPLPPSFYRIAKRDPVTKFRDAAARRAELSARPYVVHIDGKPIQKNTQGRQETGLQELDEFLTENNAIEVTSRENVEPDQLLAIAYQNAWDRLAKLGEKDPAAKLVELDVHFVLFNERADLPSTNRWWVYRPRLTTIRGGRLFHFQDTLRRQISLEAYAYSAEAVAKLITEKGALPVRRERAHLNEYLSNPDLMRP